MSVVFVAVFNDHATAEGLRTRLVNDGFPADRVVLTSRQELGQVKLVPRDGLEERLTEYFRKLLQIDRACRVARCRPPESNARARRYRNGNADSH